MSRSTVGTVLNRKQSDQRCREVVMRAQEWKTKELCCAVHMEEVSLDDGDILESNGAESKLFVFSFMVQLIKKSGLRWLDFG